MSKRNSTAVATLLTFCPPGPAERTKRSTSSSSGMAMWSSTRSIRQL
jgi:hypothetical protein